MDVFDNALFLCVVVDVDVDELDYHSDALMLLLFLKSTFLHAGVVFLVDFVVVDDDSDEDGYDVVV